MNFWLFLFDGKQRAYKMVSTYKTGVTIKWKKVPAYKVWASAPKMPVKSYPKQNRIHRGHKACHSVVEIETPMQTCETCLLRFILIRLKIQTLPGKAPLKDTEGNFS
jgi:hypothetical protein